LVFCDKEQEGKKRGGKSKKQRRYSTIVEKGDDAERKVETEASSKGANGGKHERAGGTEIL